MGGISDLLSGVVGIADQYVRQGINVSVKTNFGPEIPVYSGAVNDGSGGSSSGGGSGFSLSHLVGLKAAIIVRDQQGRTLATYGTPPPTDPVRLAIAIAAIASVAFLLLRGMVK